MLGPQQLPKSTAAPTIPTAAFMIFLLSRTSFADKSDSLVGAVEGGVQHVGQTDRRFFDLSLDEGLVGPRVVGRKIDLGAFRLAHGSTNGLSRSALRLLTHQVQLAIDLLPELMAFGRPG